MVIETALLRGAHNGGMTGSRAPLRPGFRRVTRDNEIANEASSSILACIASGLATNRADLARHLGLAPSTVTVKVAELIGSGLLEDAGNGDPTGGRRARILRLMPGAGHILSAALGRHHARLALLDLSGALIEARQIRIDVADGPEPVLEALTQGWYELLGPISPSSVHGIGVSLPGPVSTATGSVDSPAAMPGWHRYSVTTWLTERWGVPAVADNDANAMALGEYALISAREASGHDHKKPQSLLFLKAGSGVGCGLILHGQLYRGATALAGDISHTRVSAAGENPCNCGNTGCLETISGAASIIVELNRMGIEAEQTADIVRLVHDADAHATTRVRAAGRLLGETMSAVINFVNPEIVVLGGLLSTMEPFVAAVRSQLYESCHPLATRSLRIEQSEAGIDAGVLGAGQLALRHVLSAL